MSVSLQFESLVLSKSSGCVIVWVLELWPSSFSNGCFLSASGHSQFWFSRSELRKLKQISLTRVSICCRYVLVVRAFHGCADCGLVPAHCVFGRRTLAAVTAAPFLLSVLALAVEDGSFHAHETSACCPSSSPSIVASLVHLWLLPRLSGSTGDTDYTSLRTLAHASGCSLMRTPSYAPFRSNHVSRLAKSECLYRLICVRFQVYFAFLPQV